MKISNKIEHEFYESDSIWGVEPLPYQLNVLKDINYLLPKDILSILDIGCGDGFITNNLPEHMHVLGVDWSESALKYVKREKLLHSITNLPFDDDSFDLVMANDVIEHLDDDDYTSVLNEMDRIAKKYILFTLPLEEIMDNQKTLCLYCGNQYHINLHKRSYNLYNALNLLSFSKKWTPSSVVFSGEEHSISHIANECMREELQFFRHNDYSKCPSCGIKSSIDFNDSDTLIKINIDNISEKFLKKICPKNEIIILYSKNKKNKKSKKNSFSLVSNNKKYENIVNEVDGIPVFEYKEEYNSDLYIEFNFNDILFNTLIHINDNKKNNEIPEWFLIQIYNYLYKDFFSYKYFDVLKKRLNQNNNNSRPQSEQQITDLKNTRLSLENALFKLGQAEQQAIDLQNTRLSLENALLKLGQAEQQAIDFQNTHLSLETALFKLGQSEQQAIDLQNTCASLETALFKLGQSEQQAIDLQNTRASLETALFKLGQLEQQIVDLKEKFFKYTTQPIF